MLRIGSERGERIGVSRRSRQIGIVAAGLWLVSAGALTGCKPVGPDYHRPVYTAPPSYKETGAPTVVAPPNPQGGSWQPASPSDGMLKGKWWEIYQDPLLNQFEDRIATENPSLRQALETYLATRDQIAVARANLFPTLSAGPSVTHVKNSANRPLFTSSTKTNYNDLVLEGQGSWEPDFWGRVRRSVEAAHENAQANAADMANIDLTLQAQLATAYFQLRGADSLIQLLDSTVKDLESQLDLTERRLKGGVATEVDVAQAETQLETIRAQRVDVEQARAQFEHGGGRDRELSSAELQRSLFAVGARRPQCAIGRAFSTARAPAGHRRRRAPDCGLECADRHCHQRVLPQHHSGRDGRL